MGACGSRAFSIEDVQDLLKNSIVDNVIFKSISENIVPDELKLLLSRMEPLILQKGEVLFEVGSKSNDFFILITGQAHRFNIDNQWIGTVKPGQTVGDVSFLRNTPRNSTVIMTCSSTVFKLSRNNFNAVVHSVQFCARKSPFFSAFNQREVAELVQYMSTKTYRAGDHIASAGVGKGGRGHFYIVAAGSVSIDDEKVFIVNDYFSDTSFFTSPTSSSLLPQGSDALKESTSFRLAVAKDDTILLLLERDCEDLKFIKGRLPTSVEKTTLPYMRQDVMAHAEDCELTFQLPTICNRRTTTSAEGEEEELKRGGESSLRSTIDLISCGSLDVSFPFWAFDVDRTD